MRSMSRSVGSISNHPFLLNKPVHRKKLAPPKLAHTLRGKEDEQRMLLDVPSTGGLAVRSIAWRIIGALAILALCWGLVRLASYPPARDAILSWVTFGKGVR